MEEAVSGWVVSSESCFLVMIAKLTGDGSKLLDARMGHWETYFFFLSFR